MFYRKCPAHMGFQIALEIEGAPAISKCYGRLDPPRAILAGMRIPARVVIAKPIIEVLREPGVVMRGVGKTFQNIHIIMEGSSHYEAGVPGRSSERIWSGSPAPSPKTATTPRQASFSALARRSNAKAAALRTKPGAPERIRTSTPLRAQEPESCVSASSTTGAIGNYRPISNTVGEARQWVLLPDSIVFHVAGCGPFHPHASVPAMDQRHPRIFAGIGATEYLFAVRRKDVMEKSAGTRLMQDMDMVGSIHLHHRALHADDAPEIHHPIAEALRFIIDS